MKCFFNRILIIQFVCVFLSAMLYAQTPPPARTPEAPQPPDALPRDTYELVGQNPLSQYDVLRDELRKLIQSTRFPEAYGIYVEETYSPIVLIDHNGRSGYHPLQGQILITSAAALEMLGGSYRFRTTIVPLGSLQNGVLSGHLVVRGSGDPTFGGTFFMQEPPRKFDAFETFRLWAKEIKEEGIKTVAGALVMDDTAFDKQMIGPEWPSDQLGHPLMAQVSALSFRDNCVDIQLESGWRQRRKVDSELFPGIYATLYSGVLSGPKGSEPDITVKRRGDSNIVEVLGTIPVRTQYRARASIHNPSMYFGTLLRKILTDEGIEIYRSRPQHISSFQDDAALTSPSLPIVSHFSPRLSEIIPPVILQQRFETADHLFKALGLRHTRQGSFAAGSQAVQHFLESQKIDTTGSYIRDGSGRSRRNALSPKALAGVLSYMNGHGEADVFKSGLSRPGRGGPILESFKDVEQFKDNILAYEAESRTGVVLTGYVSTSGGAKLSFAFMCEDPRVSLRESQLLFAQLLNMLAGSSIKSH